MRRFTRDDRFSAPHSARLAALEGAPLATFRARGAAYAVDLLLVAVVAGLIKLPSVLSQLGAGGGSSVSLDFEGVLGVGALVAYFTLATYWGRGQTLGKRLFKIRVVSLVHERLDLWHSFERALGYAASALEAGFGFIQYFIHPNRQTVHDRIAETVVVRADWESPPRA